MAESRQADRGWTGDETIEIEMDSRRDRYLPDSELDCSFLSPAVTYKHWY